MSKNKKVLLVKHYFNGISYRNLKRKVLGLPSANDWGSGLLENVFYIPCKMTPQL